MQEYSEELYRLTSALNDRFGDGDSLNLAVLLSRGCCGESVAYEDIDIAPESRDDIILLAYEEKLLLPLKSLGGSAWGDRVLTLCEGERYYLPRVVRSAVQTAKETGEWSFACAAEECLKESAVIDEREVSLLLNALQIAAPGGKFDVGEIREARTILNIKFDMHDTIDLLVRCGLISPCTQRSLYTGLAQYEVHPCLYWDSRHVS